MSQISAEVDIFMFIKLYKDMQATPVSTKMHAKHFPPPPPSFDVDVGEVLVGTIESVSKPGAVVGTFEKVTSLSSINVSAVLAVDMTSVEVIK